MNEQIHLIEELSRFGLSHEESCVYLKLLLGGNASSYKLSKQLKLGRTKVESILRALEDKNMVFEKRKQGGSDYQAHPYKNLTSLVEIKETEVKDLSNSLEELYKKFSEITPSKDHKESNIIHYYGIEGLKQVTWNTLKAKKEMRIFEVSRLNGFLQQSFADEYRLEYLRRGLVHKDLTNESHMAGWTDIKGFAEKQELRYIDPKVLKIQFEILIYNDVVAMLDYKDNEIFCIEIYSPSLAQLQTQLFDYVWKDAKEMVVVGPRGESKIKE